MKTKLQRLQSELADHRQNINLASSQMLKASSERMAQQCELKIAEEKVRLDELRNTQTVLPLGRVA